METTGNYEQEPIPTTGAEASTSPQPQQEESVAGRVQSVAELRKLEADDIKDYEKKRYELTIRYAMAHRHPRNRGRRRR